MIQKPRGHKEDGASFPNQIRYKVSQIHNKSYSKEKNRGRETRGGGLENRGVDEQITKAAINLTQVKGYLYTRDRSDRCQGPVRPVGLQHPLYTISSDGRGSFFETKSSPRCRHLDEDQVRGFEGSVKPG